MFYRTSLTMTPFSWILLSLPISFLLSWPPVTSFAQLSSTSTEMPLTQEQTNGLAELETAKQQYTYQYGTTQLLVHNLMCS